MAEEKYDVLEKIGHGSFGIIRKVRRKHDGQILCRKEINYVRMSQKEREQLHAEFAILSSLHHPNIVGYYHREHLKSSQDLHLYMEYCGNGDLGRVIKELVAKKQYAEEGFVWSMFAQLVTALYRCHYGVDPPEVGSNVMGLGNTARPVKPTGGVMILHRDLKPENVFLGADNSVKLGDFGLSKIMQSHDFASTYVGTPFYMSPEICAAERYTLKSDIWSLGCIIYELCAREPPFNAKSHIQLVQKIREGKIASIPSVYSPELMAVIKDCLKVNPDRRPDTFQLLNLPVVKLMRKEKEVVELGRIMKTKEQAAAARLQEVDEKVKQLDQDKSRIREEIEASVRREWEVKARLEIDRLVAIEIDSLRNKFEQEVQNRVDTDVAKRSQDGSFVATSSLSQPGNDIAQCSIGTTGTGDDEFPSSTDLTEFSMDSPSDASKPLKKSTRTPFTRAQTMFHNTPMDVEMGEPSPISIACLSLSPRRNGGAKKAPFSKNIFTAAVGENRGERWQPTLMASDTEDDDDDTPVLPSPTRQKSAKNPFKTGNAGRPALTSQKTAPNLRVQMQSKFGVLGNAAKSNTAPVLPTMASQPDLRPIPSMTGLKEARPTSPNRRLSKIPSSTNILTEPSSGINIGSPTRKTSLTKKNSTGATITTSSGSGSENDLNKLAMKNNLLTKANLAPRGRTLVELAQARAGGRAIDGQPAAGEMSPVGKKFAERMTDRERERDNRDAAAMWDPERDEMPSPFLVRAKSAAGMGMGMGRKL